MCAEGNAESHDSTAVAMRRTKGMMEVAIGSREV